MTTRRSLERSGGSLYNENEESQGDSPGSYNLRRDHSKPKRYMGTEWVDPPTPIRVKQEPSQSRSPSLSPMKSPKKRATVSAGGNPRSARKPRTPVTQGLEGEWSEGSGTVSPAPPRTRNSDSGSKPSTRSSQSKQVVENTVDDVVRRSLYEQNEESEAILEVGQLDADFGTPPPTGFRARRGKAPPNPSELSFTLRENLKRLKNLLKLPKARRWVFCEFFYSDIDRELFLSDNEFSQCLRESFPNLKSRNLNKQEWTEIRRLIGKPRRCSQAFFEEEREALSHKRQKIREIHNGAVLSLDTDLVDIPSRIPQPLVVGLKVYARVRHPKDGIYSGVVDAVLPESYRIIFDKELVPPSIVKDFEVMSEAPDETVSVAYFLEKNKAAAPISVRATATAPGGQAWLSPSKVLSAESSPLLKYDPVMTAALTKGQVVSPPRAGGRLGATLGGTGAKGDERVGNFPLRLLVMLVKLSKLIEMKKSFVRQIQEMNGEAERMNLLTDHYPRPFQEKYAQVVVDLDQLNKQLAAYLNGVSEYYSTLLPYLSEVTVTSRPDALRKLCTTHALQIVRHCNNGLSVENRKALDLITSLTALLLQVRSLGQQSCNAYELNTLSEALSQIRLQVHSSNTAAFQDNVEVHMKQIHYSMMQQAESAVSLG